MTIARGRTGEITDEDLEDIKTEEPAGAPNPILWCANPAESEGLRDPDDTWASGKTKGLVQFGDDVMDAPYLSRLFSTWKAQAGWSDVT